MMMMMMKGLIQIVRLFKPDVLKVRTAGQSPDRGPKSGPPRPFQWTAVCGRNCENKSSDTSKIGNG